MRFFFYFLITIVFVSLFVYPETSIAFTFDNEKINAAQQSSFIENKGQWDDNILFAARLNGLNVAITENGIVYDYYALNNSGSKKMLEGHVVAMNFLGTNGLRFSAPNSVNNPVSNFFYGNNPYKWITGARHFNSVKLESIYPGIDLMLTVQQGNPRYDFLVSPGADPSVIKFYIAGGNYFTVNNEGNLSVGTRLGDKLHGNIYAYQHVNGKEVKIDCRFVADAGFIGFELGSYDKSLPLVIDPLVYASFWGGSGDETVQSMQMPDNNSFIICGNTTSNDLKTTPGSYSEYYQDNQDVYISKFVFEGTNVNLVFSTFIGTLDMDEVTGMGIDENGRIYIAGNTKSMDFPNENAYQRDFSGVTDGFITKFNSDCSQLLYSTFFGGSREDRINAIYVNRKGNVYLVGETSSSNFPVDAGAYQNKKKALNDAFISKLNTNGTQLEFSTYLGGNNEDKGLGISVDESGKTYVTGMTNSQDFPPIPYLEYWGGYILEQPYDYTYNGGWDAFVACISEGSVVYSTFFGGTGEDIGKAVVANEDGTCYVAGITTGGTGFPLGLTPYQASNKGGTDVFFAKLDKILKTKQWGFDYKSQALLFSTFLGGSGNDSLYTIMKQTRNNTMLVYGTTKSFNFPITDPASKYAAGNDGFVTEFGLTGSAIITSRLFSGQGEETINGIGIDELGNYIYVGTTSTQNQPTTANSQQAAYGGGATDAYIFKNVNVNISIASPIGSEAICKGTETEIRWITEGIPDNDKIKIEIKRNIETGTWKTITENATNKTFKWTIPDDFEAANDYIIRVSHSSGVSSQSVQNFAILPKPLLSWIKSNPEKSDFCPGETVEFTSSATGNELTYQWYYNDAMLKDQTNPTLVIEDLKAEHAGAYKLVVNDKCPPPLNSESITINLLTSTTITMQPKDTAVKKTETIELKIEAQGTNIKFEWFKDGSKIIGETTKSVKIQSAVITDQGKYYCVVTGDCGTVESDRVTVTVDTATSSVRTGDYAQNGFGIVSAYMNSEKSIKVKLQSDYEGFTNIKLSDIFGNITSQLPERNIKTGSSEYLLPAENLPSGVYWVIAELGSYRSVKKLIIVN